MESAQGIYDRTRRARSAIPQTDFAGSICGWADRRSGDLAVWLEMLRARNSMSHIYDDELTAKIAQRIDAVFLPVLQSLAQFFKT